MQRRIQYRRMVVARTGVHQGGLWVGA